MTSTMGKVLLYQYRAVFRMGSGARYAMTFDVPAGDNSRTQIVEAMWRELRARKPAAACEAATLIKSPERLEGSGVWAPAPKRDSDRGRALVAARERVRVALANFEALDEELYHVTLRHNAATAELRLARKQVEVLS